MARATYGLVSAVFALFWAVTATAQGGNYLIQPGDTLSVEVLEDSTLNRAVLVTPDGRVSFPLAGTVQAAGRTVTQVQRSIASALESSFANRPTVFVAVSGVSAPTNEPQLGETLTVYLVGEINAPGPKAVLPGTTVLQLLSQSGGFTPFAATKRLQLRRTAENGAQRMITINYRAIARGAEITREPVLQDGDVILVPERRLFE
jgi:polysaccharide export outer membrane protein